MPRVVSAPTSGRTDSDFAKQVGADLGMAPDADQCEILDAIYRVREDGNPACFEVAVIAPRQNIKTSTLEIAALTDLFVFGEPLHIWTAHLFDTAQKTFKHMRALIESAPQYRELCRWPPRTANGDEAIELLTGEAIEFYARSKRAARGFAGVGKITLDEALFLDPDDLGAILPTTATVPGAQIRYGSSAGMVDSLALRGIRNRGRAGGEGIGYFEWYSERRDCATKACTHAVGVDGCALDDRSLRAESNPALGRRISHERLDQFRQAMPPGEFAREFLGWWDEGPEENGGVFGDGWAKARDYDSQVTGQATFAVEVAEDRAWSCIGVAGPGLLGTHVESVDYRPGTGWVVEAAKMLHRIHRGASFVVHVSSPAGSLITDLENAGLTVVKASTQDYAQACGDFTDAVNDSELRHLGQVPLDLSVAGAKTKPHGDAFVWDRRKSLDISPLAAVTLAFWGSNRKKDRPGRFIAF